MRRAPLAACTLCLLLGACATSADRATIAQLRHVRIEVKEERVEGGIDKAIQGYERFLAETGESPLVPEAIRRLADLKVEKEYGYLGGTRTPAPAAPGETRAVALARPPQFQAPAEPSVPPVLPPAARKREAERDFEQRATAAAEIKSAPRETIGDLPGGADLERAGAREAIALYRELLAKYPLYERKDQVLYHMARAHEELGEVEQAMAVMDRLVKEHPRSKYYDEVQFRRGEFFFTRKKILDAEEAYKAVVDIGPGSAFYELALYKLGWTFYKQELYEDALDRFTTLLDYKASTGFDFEKSTDELEKQRVDDTYRVISLSFSNLGGSEAIAAYFDRRGKRPYEVDIYRNLAEFYLEKRRYQDAALTYKAFVKRDPFHKVAPQFDMEVIATYRKGGFPRLVIDATKEFARSYGLKAAYWKHHDPQARPEVIGYLKENLRTLATHYHALYQDKRHEKTKAENFAEALVWYREFLASFPRDSEAPAMHYQLAELLLEHKMYAAAAVEYEKTAYDYPPHEKGAAAGYAAVYAHREALKAAAPSAQAGMKREIIRSSLRFVDTYPDHEKAAVVLGAAADDLYEMKEYETARTQARRLIAQYPQAEPEVRRGAWLVVGHASLELNQYPEAEEGYRRVLQLTAADAKDRAAVVDNLAAAIYKQGEEASKRGDHATAANHFLRIAEAAPTSKIRPIAEYDGATALLQLKEWDRAIAVLQAFRAAYPKHELQPEVTKKVAYAYKEAGRLALAAAEYERIEVESKDEDERRGALSLAAELYEQAGEHTAAVRVYRRYVDIFPRPLELALEARHKLAGIYKTTNDTKSYRAELERIVAADARAGAERTDRTRYLAAVSALALTEPLYHRFVEIRLVKPFEKNLARKRQAMKQATDAFGKLVEYRAGEVTAAAAYYIAEIYYHFSRALLESERPDDLNELEREQYELALEEQAYPFEERAIALHEKNLELLGTGVYNAWIDKSLAKLAQLVPARYAKAEEGADFIDTLGPVQYASGMHLVQRRTNGSGSVE